MWFSKLFRFESRAQLPTSPRPRKVPHSTHSNHNTHSTHSTHSTHNSHSTHSSSSMNHHAASTRRSLLLHRCFLPYLLASAALILVLTIDPHFNHPHGLIPLSLFATLPGPPRGHGACPPNHISWQIGTLNGTSPLDTTFSEQPVLNCTSLSNTSYLGHVSDPFLYIPPTGDLWHLFYRVHTAHAHRSVIGVAASRDAGASWHHLGTALSARVPLAAPFVSFDPATQQYVLIPELQPPDAGGVQIYTTTPAQFPLGWQRARRPADAGPAPGGAAARALGTVAAQLDGRWWMFTTTAGAAPWRWWPWLLRPPEPVLSLRLYHSDSLLGRWQEHPRSPITSDPRYARSGGRPFVMDGHLYRWAQDDSDGTGGTVTGGPNASASLEPGSVSTRSHLFKIEELSLTEYWENYELGLGPSEEGDSRVPAWARGGVHGFDVQPVGGPDGAWFGVVAGVGGNVEGWGRHAEEMRFAGAKALLLRVLVVQVVLVSVAVAAWSQSDGAAAAGWWQGGAAAGWQALPQQVRHGKRRSGSGAGGCGTCGGGLCSGCGDGPPCGAVWRRRVATRTAAAAVALLLPPLLFAAAPAALPCPRWNVRVDVGLTPPVTHHDPAAPYPVSDLVVVTGATANFFDRTSNMIGSIHAWEPRQRVVVYDLGYSAEQLAAMQCWRNVEIRRFPYEDYPPHVSDVTNYAFKALVIQHALRSAEAVVWIDSGLELRAPMDTLRRQLSHHGHVSAMQEEQMGAPMYDPAIMRTMAGHFGLADIFATTQSWMFCAGGLQGFVRGSDAERLVLNPVVDCSLHELECIAPPGSSRDNHNFDQTAFSLAIWAAGFSCLPRETHCMWSVKKASRNPLGSSAPIELVSRGHRRPKPYTALIRQVPMCEADEGRIPWPVNGTRKESLSRHGIWFKISRVYLQQVGDLFVMAFACLGVHVAVLLLFWAELWGLWRWRLSTRAWGLSPPLSPSPTFGSWWATSKGRMVRDFLLGTPALLALQALLFFLASNAR